MQQIFRLVDHYHPIVVFLSIAGGISFIALSQKDKKIQINRLLITALILVFFYEILALILATNKITNHWVYLIFFNHFAVWINLLILREFIFRSILKKIILGLMVALFLFSGLPYMTGIIPLNDTGEYPSLLGGSFVLLSCGMFFYELLSNDRYLSISLLQFSGFWIGTLLLFFYSGSFMIFISYGYLINNYLDIYFIVIELTRTTALLLYLTYFLSLAKWKKFRILNLNDIP